MNKLILQQVNINKRISILKVLTAISFLLIVDPFVVAAPGSADPTFINYLTGVQLAIGLKQVFFLKGQPFGLQGTLLTAYFLSVIYLLFFPHSRTRGLIVLELIALFVLCIPAFLITAVGVSGFLKYIPGIVTIALFWVLAIMLFTLLFKKLTMPLSGHYNNNTAV